MKFFQAKQIIEKPIEPSESNSAKITRFIAKKIDLEAENSHLESKIKQLRRRYLKKSISIGCQIGEYDDFYSFIDFNEDTREDLLIFCDSIAEKLQKQINELSLQIEEMLV